MSASTTSAATSTAVNADTDFVHHNYCAATATITIVDTYSVVADNQATFQKDDGPSPVAADLSRICEKLLLVGHFDNKKTDI